MVPTSHDGDLEETRSFKTISPGTVISHYKIIEKLGSSFTVDIENSLAEMVTLPGNYTLEVPDCIGLPVEFNIYVDHWGAYYRKKVVSGDGTVVEIDVERKKTIDLNIYCCTS